MINLIVLATAILAYFVGAIPVGYIVTRLKGIKDIRQHGSGNIGATNVARVLGKHYFFLIFLLDAGKAYLFMHLIFKYYPENYLCFFALIVLLANGCSIFLSGGGGKGGATACGLVYAFHPWIIGVTFSVWVCLLYLTHTVGIASVGACFAASICVAIFYYNQPFFWFSVCVCAWICFTHRSNIQIYYRKNYE